MANRVLKTFGAALLGLSLAACGTVEDVDTPYVDAKDSDVQATLAQFKDAQVLATEDGEPTFIRGRLGRAPEVSALKARDGMSEALRESVSSLAPVFRLSGEDLVFKRASQDARGHRYLRFQQVKDGLRVVGGELLLHVDDAGDIYAANGSLRRSVKVTKARVAPEAAARAAVDSQGTGLEAGAAQLVYFKPDGEKQAQLAYSVPVRGVDASGTPVDGVAFMSAETGTQLAWHTNIHSALNRKVYSANNGSTTPGTLKRSEGDAATGDAHVDDNYNHLGTTYNCYSVNFGRDSYNAAGATLTSTVHYSTNYVNAYWDGTQMVYGDGNGVDSGPLGKSLDVTVHELTHAVTDSESDLVYSNESGALNEGMSDIFSAYCEAWTKNWVTDAAVYMIGDDIWTPATPGDALRYMANPTQDGSSKDYYPERYIGSSDNGGVHWNSGIANLAFKLLSEGGTHPRGKTTTVVTGIGIQKAGKIFYEANANCMTSSSNFAAAKTCTEQKAEAFYGAAEKAATTAAWEAVGVGIVVPPPTSTPLANGVAVTNLSDSTGGNKYYKLDVPAGQTSLVFDITGGTGDADMSVKFGTAPDASTYDCRPYKSGNVENCTFTNPAAGTWYVMVNAFSAYSGLSLKGTYGGGGGGGGTPTQETRSGSVAAGAWSPISSFSVKAGTQFKVVMSGTGDPDLYVRWGSAPTTTSYSCRPYASGASETCDIPVPAGTTAAYVGVRGYSSATYNLTINYTKP